MTKQHERVVMVSSKNKIPFTGIELLDLAGNPLDPPSTWAMAYMLGYDSSLRKLCVSSFIRRTTKQTNQQRKKAF